MNWFGAGRYAHNTRAADGSWSTGEVLGSLDQFEGGEALIIYNGPGEHAFFCTYHVNADGEGIAGTLIVEAAG